MPRQVIRYMITPYGEAVLRKMERERIAALDLEGAWTRGQIEDGRKQDPAEVDAYRQLCWLQEPPESEDAR